MNEVKEGSQGRKSRKEGRKEGRKKRRKKLDKSKRL